MHFKSKVKSCLIEKYWSIQGRASRSEFWGFTLFTLAVMVLLALFTGSWRMKPLFGLWLDPSHGFYLLRIVGTLIELALFVPAITVTIRRFHDIGLSGWWYLTILISSAYITTQLADGEILGPLFGLIALSGVALRKGTYRGEKYGPAPEAPAPENAREYDRSGHKRLWIGLRPLTARIGLAAIGLIGLLDVAIAHLYTPAPQPAPYFDPDRQQVMLRDAGRDRHWGNHDDAVWAFSFPKSANVQPTVDYKRVTLISAEDVEKTHKQGYAVLSTELRPRQPTPDESTLKLLVTLPDFGTLAGTFEDHPNSALEISLPSQQRLYDGTPDWGTVPSFTDEFEKLTRFNCEFDREIAPGITRLQEMSPTSAQAALEAFRNRGPRYETRDGCIGKAAARGASYALTDDTGSATGFGTCQSYRKAAQYGTCRFQFWLPQKRIIEYRFSEEFLPMLRDIDSHARTVLAQATVAHASKNIDLPTRQTAQAQ
ncbi:DUF805 domain-containing protein [Roseovarius sp. A21]|uniref:DUF805 domain-containing protein n=1 Tax=Roseovarius bejariae TaxID=2576383 RepID=A0A844CQQ6_9RHOB|nr:DUF805 domain-containing protein [Roseovarius bejariae]MRU16922.1 DUF805 domain-containing protein [Roseovarius bejariae]